MGARRGIRVGKRLKDSLGARTASGGGGDGARPRVLVVDDDRRVRELCELTLTEAGFDVRAVASAPEALAHSSDPQEPALLVLDLSLPEAGAVARAYTPAAGLLLISGHAPGDFGVDPRAVAFLAKPFTPEELVDAARSAHVGRRQQAGGPFRFDTRDGHLAPTAADAGAAGPPARRSTTERRVLVTAGVTLAVLVAGGIVVVAGGGRVDQSAVAVAPTAAAPVSEPSISEPGPEGSSSGEGASDPTESPRAVVAPEPEPTPARTTEPAEDASSDGAVSPGTRPSPDASAEASAAPSPAVAYAEPDKAGPVLGSCARHDGADGSAEYTVAFTVEFAGGNYDVLPGEPFVADDRTVEVRGGTLVWRVVATHVASPADGDTFEVVAPSEFGWADPGSDDRRHTYLPPPLTVRADDCR